ncbi:hypothetical protein D3C84_850680 [compost metagenome]
MVSLWLAPPMDPDPATIASNAMLTQRLAAHPYSPFRFARILDRASEELSRQPGTSPELIQLIQQMKDVQNRAAEVIAESDAELSPC